MAGAGDGDGVGVLGCGVCADELGVVVSEDESCESDLLWMEFAVAGLWLGEVT